MITEQDLLDAIAECQGERNPNANTCIKLAAYYTILNNTSQEYSFATEPTGVVRYSSGSEFSDAVYGLDVDNVMAVMDELMNTIQVLAPKIYNAVLERFKR